MCATRATAVLYLTLSVLIAATALEAEERPLARAASPAARVDLRPAFEENAGQVDTRVRFVSKSARQTLFLTADEAVLALRSLKGPAALRLRLQGANGRALVTGLELLPTRTYYANAASRGALEPVRTYRRVRYSDVYPGIDLEYYRTNEHLEFDFNVAPHADPSRIELSLAGADSITKRPNGELHLSLGGEDVILKRPVVFQMQDGDRHEVQGEYVLSGSTVRFALGAYDTSLPLVIDPVIAYATYLGGTGDDFVVAADVNEAGELYLFGRTNNGVAFPRTQVEPAQHTIDPINCFVSKLSADGTTLLFSVLFEGFGVCEAFELEGDRVHVGMQAQLGNYNGFAQLRTLIDNGGVVAVAGLKGGPFVQIPGAATRIEDIRSDDFGSTYVLYHQLAGGALQGGLLKLDALGNAIDLFDVGVLPDSSPSLRAMAVDNFGQVFIVGRTIYDLVTTPDAFQPTRPAIATCQDNGFLIRIDTKTQPFQQTYGTFLAGSGCDSALGVVRDPLGFVYVTGRTTSSDFPIPGLPMPGGPGGDGFLMKFDLSQTGGSQLVAGSYLGLQFGTGTQGVADGYHPLVRLPSGLLAITGGATGWTLPLQNYFYDASSAPGFPRFLQVYSKDLSGTILSTHLDAGGAATHAVAATQERNRLSSPQNYLFVVTNTPEGGLGTAGRLQEHPAGGGELLIRNIDYADLAASFAPHVELGPDLTIEAADAGGADFDLSCIGCDIAALGDLLVGYHWTIDGARHTLSGPPFAGQITLPVGTHRLELVVENASGLVGVDTFVVTVTEPAANEPPLITVGADQIVTATSPDGVLLYAGGAVRDPDGDTLDVTIVAGTTTVQFEVFPPFFSGNAFALVRMPIGANIVTMTVSDNRGHITTAQYNIVVRGTNTPAGTGVEVRPVDDTFQYTYGFTPGKVKLTFAGVASEGFTWFRTRTNQIPPPPGAPNPKQLGNAPFYYDVTTTATTSGDIRVCIDTTGMSFVDRSAIRLYRLNSTAWDDVTVPSTAGEAAERLICGVTPSAGPNIGTFAIFTPANESTRVTTIVGNGGAWVPGNPAPGDGGPANQAPIHFPQNFVIDAPRQVAYVEDSIRIRRVDLQTNTITTFAGHGGGGIEEPDGALATEISVSAGGIGVDRDGNVFIAGINGCSILRIDINTRRVRRVAGIGPNPATLECRYAGDGGRATEADINGARRIVFDAQGNLFFIQTVFSSVLAGPGYAIRRVAAGADQLITGDDPAEIISTVAGGGTQWPPENGDPRLALIDAQDLAFNPQGDLYVGGTAFVVRITPAPGATIVDGRPGEHLSVVVGEAILRYAPYQGDGGPALEANLNGPWGIDILPNGDLLIADMMASRIRMVTAGPDGVVNGGPGEIISTIAGFTSHEADIYNVPFGGDGYALSTNFLSPRDVVVDPRGGYNVVDTGYNRIRHVGLLPASVPRADIEVVAETSSIDTGVNVPVTSHVRITNRGPAAATNAGVEMFLPANAQIVSATSPAGFCVVPVLGLGGRVFCEARTMAPGGSVLMTFVLNPTSGDDLTATFTGGASEEDPAPGNNSSTASVRVITPIDLGVAVAATPARMRVLDPFAYTVTVSNLSTRPAGVMRMNATLPPSLRFDSATPAGICSPLGNVVTCDVDNFAAGSTLVITLNVTPLTAGTATSTFVVSNPSGDPNPANDSASIDVIVDNLVILVNEVIRVTDSAQTLPAAMIPINETIHVSDGPPVATGAVMIPVNETIHVTDTARLVGPNVSILKEILDDRGLGYPAGEVNAGDVVRFRLRVTNQAGAGPTTGPVVVTDILDSRLAYLADVSDPRCGLTAQTIECIAPAPLAAGAFVDFVIQARAAHTAAAPNQTVDIINQATVATAGDETAGDNTSAVTLTVRGVLPPSVFVTKLASLETYVAGDLVPFTLTVTNRRNAAGNPFALPEFGSTYEAITLTDVLDQRFEFVPQGTDARCGATGQTVRCVVNDPLPPGGSIPFAVVVRVRPNAAPPGQHVSIPNTAEVSTPGDVDSSDNQSTVLVTVTGQRRPDVSIEKQIESPCSPACQSVDVANGADVVYRLTVRLNGDVDHFGPLTGPITVTDTLPTGIVPRFASGGPAPRFACSIAGQQVTCSFSSWTLFAQGTESTIDITGRVADNLAGLNQIITLPNTAEASTADDADATNNTSAPATIRVMGPRAPDVSIAKSIVDDSAPCGSACQNLIAVSGDTVRFVLDVRVADEQAGFGPLTGPLTVTDTLPQGLIPTLAFGTTPSPRFVCSIVGQQVTCNLTAWQAVRPGDAPGIEIHARVAAGVAPPGQTATLVNTATLATPDDANPGNNTSGPATVTVRGPRRPDLYLFKRIPDASSPCNLNCQEINAANGREVTFRLTTDLHEFSGPLTGPVTITDTLPAGLVPIQAFDSSGDPFQARFTCVIAGQQVTCTLTDFAHWGSHGNEITIVARVGGQVAGFSQTVTLVNTASIATSDADPRTSTAATVYVIGPRRPDLYLFKRIHDPSQPCNFNCGETTVSNGSEVTFRLTTDSFGQFSGPLTGPATVTDTLPAGLVPIQAFDSSGDPFRATFNCTIAGQQVTCTLTDFANWGDHSHTLIVVARVSNHAAGANETVTLVNTATVATPDEQNTSNNQSSASVFVRGPVIGAPTNVGSNVIVRPTDANNIVQPLTVRFAGVTAPGVTAAIPIVPPPAAPALFRFRGVVYDISTTAAYVPPIEVCFDNGPFLPADRVWHAGVVLPIGAHTIRTAARLCVVVNSLSPFGVVTPLDTTAPVVTPPPAITVPATEAGGARGLVSAAVAAFLAGGSAIDLVDPAPARLPVQVGANIVDDNTLFPLGKTIVTFAFRDASGNIGSATSSVTVVVGTPKISIQIAAAGVVSGKRKFVDLTIANTGTGNARQLSVDLIALVPTKGLGIPRLLTTMPIAVGSLDAGTSTTVRVLMDVPTAVKRVAMTEIGRFKNVKGQLGAYVESQEFVVPDEQNANPESQPPPSGTVPGADRR